MSPKTEAPTRRLIRSSLQKRYTSSPANSGSIDQMQTLGHGVSRGPRVALPVIIDTDPAIGYPGRDVDDGLALLALLADPAIEVLGLTITFGNVSLARGLVKAREILSRAGRSDIPVLAGAASSKDLGRDTDASLFLQQEAKHRDGALVVLGIGPMTNLATAARDASFLPSLRELILLGGVLSSPSRLTLCRGFEFNFRQDIQAARCLLGVAPRLRLFPMEVCRTLVFGPLELAKLFTFGGVAAWAAYHSLFWLALSPFIWGAIGFHPWDVLPALALNNPALFTYETGCYRVGSHGELSPAPEGQTLQIATHVNTEAFWRCFWDRFRCYQVQK